MKKRMDIYKLTFLFLVFTSGISSASENYYTYCFGKIYDTLHVTSIEKNITKSKPWAKWYEITRTSPICKDYPSKALAEADYKERLDLFEKRGVDMSSIVYIYSDGTLSKQKNTPSNKNNSTSSILVNSDTYNRDSQSKKDSDAAIEKSLSKEKSDRAKSKSNISALEQKEKNEIAEALRKAKERGNRQ